MMKALLNFTLLGLCVLLVSCSSGLKPLSSTPPAKKLRVEEPFKWGNFLTIKLDMPAGEYTPKYEDEEGYFYEAPQKITGSDTFLPLLLDGGLYFEKGLSAPAKLYMIRNNYGIPTKLMIGDKAKITLIK